MSFEQILFILALVVSLVMRAVNQARVGAEEKRKAARADLPELPEEPPPFEPAFAEPPPRYVPPPPRYVPSPPPLVPLVAVPRTVAPPRVPRRPPPARVRPTRAALLHAELRNEARQRHAIVLAAVIGPPVGSQIPSRDAGRD